MSTGNQANPNLDLTIADTDDLVPGFASSSLWNSKVPADASVTASDRGVLVVDGKDLTVLDSTTGDVRYKETSAVPPTFAVDTMIDNRPALLWQAGDSAKALFDGSSKPQSFALPEHARISSAGESVLVKNGNSLYTFDSHGLVAVPTPEPGSTPMSVESGKLISADFYGPVVSTDIHTKEKTETDLEAPADDLKIIKWISVGHGLAITLWGENGASTTSGHRIQLVVHSLDDGSILSTVSTTTDIVGEKSWVRGQANQRAYIGPYVFDMTTGLLLMDTSNSSINLAEPRGTIIPCTAENDSSCLISGDHAFRTDAELLALTNEDSIAIVDGPNSTIQAFPRKPE